MSANAMGPRRLAFVLALSCGLTACESDVEPLTPAQREAIAAYVSNAPPSPQHPLSVDFSGKAKLLGYDIDHSAWGRGETIRVTWHWQATAPLSRGWELFTQIEDPESKRVLASTPGEHRSPSDTSNGVARPALECRLGAQSTTNRRTPATRWKSRSRGRRSVPAPPRSRRPSSGRRGAQICSYWI